MLTNNYIAHQHNTFFNISGDSIVHGISGMPLTNVTGNTIYESGDTRFRAGFGYNMFLGRCMSIYTGAAASSDPTNPGVYFGSGGSPASKTDYTLNAPITSGLSISTDTTMHVFSDEGCKYTVQSSWGITNTTDTIVTIREVGLFVPVIVSGSGKWHLVLMERTVLDDPLTIPAGEARLVTYKITFNQPV